MHMAGEDKILQLLALGRTKLTFFQLNYICEYNSCLEINLKDTSRQLECQRYPRATTHPLPKKLEIYKVRNGVPLSFCRKFKNLRQAVS